jgi:hypothetical protein
VLNGKRFALMKPTLAHDGAVRQGWISIPAGAIVRIISDRNGNESHLIDVLWEGRMVKMFAIDLTSSGAEITSQRASA